MRRFIDGERHRQIVLLREYLDDFIDEDKPARVARVRCSRTFVDLPSPHGNGSTCTPHSPTHCAGVEPAMGMPVRSRWLLGGTAGGDFDALVTNPNFRRRGNGYRNELALHNIDRRTDLARHLAPAMNDVRVDAVRQRYLRDRRGRSLALGQDLCLQLRAIPPALATLFDFPRVQLFAS